MRVGYGIRMEWSNTFQRDFKIEQQNIREGMQYSLGGDLGYLTLPFRVINDYHDVLLFVSMRASIISLFLTVSHVMVVTGNI